MNKKLFLILLSIVLGVNMLGLLNDIFTMDSSLYAVISKSFAQSHDYLNMFVDGKDWLDKPHFQFWICGLSMQLFGINTFGYKFPSICFFLLGMLYTYKLAKTLYNRETAYLAVLILGSSLHIIISNNDTRAEAILLGLIMGAVYYLHKLPDGFTLKNVLFASLFSAAAIMTKGIFILIVIYSAIFGNLIFKKEFYKLLNVKWIAVFILTIIFITPELYALYNQFDLHPEKTVFNKNNVSGVKFFLWDSQFGRFFNTGPIKGQSDKFFFVHTMLWAVAPWAILGFMGLIIFCRNIFKRIKQAEALTFFGFIIMFLVFSISKFQLPHYINIILPFLAILIAAHLTQETQYSKRINAITKISIGVYGAVYIIMIGFTEYFFKTNYSFQGILIMIASLLLFVTTYIYKYNLNYKYVVYGVLASMLFGLYLNTGFYPELLKYQSGSQAAFFCNREYPSYDIVTNKKDWLLQFYFKNKIQYLSQIDTLVNPGVGNKVLVFADGDYLNKMNEAKLNYSILKEFDQFHITGLTKDFFYYKTRQKTLQKRYLLNLKSSL